MLVYVKLSPSSKKCLPVDMDRHANQVTAACVSGGRDFERLSVRGINALLQGARQGWYLSHDVDSIAAENIAESAADAWERF